MPLSLSAVFVHLVFSTKGRRPYFPDEAERAEVHAYLGGVSNTLGCHPLAVGGVEDHVHLLGSLARTTSVADWVKELKRVSHRWLQERDPKIAAFGWQAGYGAFSVSRSQLESVRRYVENQVEHHRRTTFQDEFRALLSRHGIQWDERFVWD